jgi:hypothetical protein
VIGCVASSALIAFYLIFPGFALGYVNTGFAARYRFRTSVTL